MPMDIESRPGMMLPCVAMGRQGPPLPENLATWFLCARKSGSLLFGFRLFLVLSFLIASTQFLVQSLIIKLLVV